MPKCPLCKKTVKELFSPKIRIGRNATICDDAVCAECLEWLERGDSGKDYIKTGVTQ